MKTLFTGLIAILIFIPTYSMAELISWTDPVGDQTGIVDLVGMDFTFDATGDYTIDLIADEANPFVGDFRININLFNVTLDELFQDTFNDYSLAVSQTSLTLTGNNLVLSDWLASHTIATSTFDGYGNPPGSTFFRSSAADLPFEPVCTSEDIIGLDGCGTTSVPEPTSLVLVGLGLAGLGFVRRKKAA